MTVCDASLTSQSIASWLVSAGSAPFQGADSPCSFAAARRNGDHGDLDGGRSIVHLKVTWRSQHQQVDLVSRSGVSDRR